MFPLHLLFQHCHRHRHHHWAGHDGCRRLLQLVSSLSVCWGTGAVIFTFSSDHQEWIYLPTYFYPPGLRDPCHNGAVSWLFLAGISQTLTYCLWSLLYLCCCSLSEERREKTVLCRLAGWLVVLTSTHGGWCINRHFLRLSHISDI